MAWKHSARGGGRRGAPHPQGLRGWRRGCGESGRGAARSRFCPGDGFLSESGRGRRRRGCALSHCPSPQPRSLFFSVWWVWAWCLLPPVRGKRGKRWSRPSEGSLARGTRTCASSGCGRGSPQPPTYRGAAGSRFLLVVGRLGRVLAAPGAGEGGFSAALWGFGGGVFILLGQGEEVAEPGRKRGRGQALPGQAHAPGRGTADLLHLVGFVAAGLDVLQGLQDWGLAENCRGTRKRGVRDLTAGAGSPPPWQVFGLPAGCRGFCEPRGGGISIPEHPSPHLGSARAPRHRRAMGTGGGTYSSVWCWSG